MQKKKCKQILLLSIILVQALFMLLNNTTNARAQNIQDDSDIQATLHCRLLTDSAEMLSYLMPTGMYDFFEQPDIDIGSFSHDLTRITVDDLQYASENYTSYKNGNLNVPGNITQNITTNAIPQYDCSAPKDTLISVNINYNFTNYDVITANINPNVDVTKQWSSTASNHYTEIDEGTSPNTADYISTNIANKIDTFNIETIDLNSNYANITQITCHLYVKQSYMMSGNLRVYVSGTGLSETYISTENAAGWKTITWSNLHLKQDDLDDLQFSFKSYTFFSDTIYIYTAYLGIVYQNISSSAQSTPFQAVQLNNFKYQELGTNYTQTFNLTYNSILSNYVYTNNSCNVTYYFSSAILIHYDHISDLTILTQNLTMTFYFYYSGVDFNYSCRISYSINEWKVPSEINFEINSQDISDESFSSGYIAFDTFQTSLNFTSSWSQIYFSLNITVDFIMTMSLDVISRTYLKKVFELLSNHAIVIDQITLDQNLRIKRLYLNNIEFSSYYNNTIYSIPAVQMNTNNIFTLEVILTDEIYIPLNNIYNSLGSGTSQSYLAGLSNALSYNDINRFSCLNINLPTGFNSEHANLTFSDINYKQSYISNSSHDTYAVDVETQNTIVSNESVTVNSKFLKFGSNTTNLNNATTTNGKAFNITSCGYLSKHFPATYSFTTTPDNTDPSGWTDTSTGTSTANIISQFGNHKKVYDCYDSNSGDAIINQAFSARTTGTIEFYFANSVTTQPFYVDIYDASTYKMEFALQNSGQITAWNGTATINLQAYSANTWYHCRIDFNSTSDKYDIYINNIKRGNQLNYYAAGGDITRYLFATYGSIHHGYLDAVGYSWDSNYAIGMNLNDTQYNITSFYKFQSNLNLNQIKSFKISYNLKTNITQLVNVSINNFYLNSYQLINSSNKFNAFYTNNYTRDNRTQNYFSNSNPCSFNVSIAAENITNYASHQFQISIDYLNLYIEFYNSTQKIPCYIDFLNQKGSYDNDGNLYALIYLRDENNQPLTSKVIQYSIDYYDGSNVLNGGALTNGSGIIVIDLLFDAISYDVGFYHLNCSYSSNQYLNYSKMMSFELLPIEYAVNSSDINLQVNSNIVINNFIQINYTSTFIISCDDNSTFDLDIAFKLNYTQNISYSQFLDYAFTFNASSSVSYISFTDANLTNCPTNYTTFYFDNLASVNYVLTGTNFQIKDVISDVFYDNSDFEIEFRHYSNSIQRTQITVMPTTEASSVIFTENMLANRSFSYWYFANSLSINSVSLSHVRTGSTINDFSINNSKYYFIESSLANDVFIATVDYNPNWAIIYDIQINNGTYTKIEVDYAADLDISNVSIILNLRNDGCFNDNWTLNSTQNSANFKLTIPNLNFTTSQQTIYVEGYSAIPYAAIPDYESDQNWKQITEDAEIDFAAFLTYPKFTQLFLLNVQSSWTCYDIYYGNEIYSANTVSATKIKCSGDGFDPTVDDSFLYFRTEPFSKVDWNYNEKTDIITITIESDLDVDNCFFKYEWDPTGAHTLMFTENNTEVYGLTDSGDFEGYLFFYIPHLSAGKTVIEIEVNFATPLEMLLQSLIVFSCVGGMIFFYYYALKNEGRRKKLREWIGKRGYDKLIKKREEKALSEVVISTNKNNEIVIKSTKNKMGEK